MRAAVAARRLRLFAASLLVASLCPLAGPARAGEGAVELRAAPGRETVAANCAGCHSLDYIAMNSPFLTRAQWRAEVAKMIDAFGAPVAAADAAAIVDYLAENYSGRAP